MDYLDLDVIRTDGGTQIRSGLNEEKVAEYLEAMQEGDQFPEIVVHYDGTNYWLSSGFHRLAAVKRLGRRDIAVKIEQGSLDDARDYACSANARHGLPMTQEERRNAARRLLTSPNNNGWTNTYIARQVGLSKMTVGRIKTALEEKEPKPEASGQGSEKQKKSVSESTPREPRPEEPAQPEMPDEGEQRFNELADTIESLTEENQKLRDAIAVGQWDASEIEKIDVQDTIDELRDRIKVLEIDNAALRDSRDMYQQRNAELMATVKSLQAKLKKVGG